MSVPVCPTCKKDKKCQRIGPHITCDWQCEACDAPKCKRESSVLGHALETFTPNSDGTYSGKVEIDPISPEARKAIGIAAHLVHAATKPQEGQPMTMPRFHSKGGTVTHRMVGKPEEFAQPNIPHPVFPWMFMTKATVVEHTDKCLVCDCLYEPSTQDVREHPVTPVITYAEPMTTPREDAEKFMRHLEKTYRPLNGLGEWCILKARDELTALIERHRADAAREDRHTEARVESPVFDDLIMAMMEVALKKNPAMQRDVTVHTFWGNMKYTRTPRIDVLFALIEALWSEKTDAQGKMVKAVQKQTMLFYYYEPGDPDSLKAAEQAVKAAGERYASVMPRPRGNRPAYSIGVDQGQIPPELVQAVKEAQERMAQRGITGSYIQIKAIPKPDAHAELVKAERRRVVTTQTPVYGPSPIRAMYVYTAEEAAKVPQTNPHPMPPLVVPYAEWEPGDEMKQHEAALQPEVDKIAAGFGMEPGSVKIRMGQAEALTKRLEPPSQLDQQIMDAIIGHAVPGKPQPCTIRHTFDAGVCVKCDTKENP